jgi:hypothetical protein
MDDCLKKQFTLQPSFNQKNINELVSSYSDRTTIIIVNLLINKIKIDNTKGIRFTPTKQQLYTINLFWANNLFKM